MQLDQAVGQGWGGRMAKCHSQLQEPGQAEVQSSARDRCRDYYAYRTQDGESSWYPDRWAE